MLNDVRNLMSPITGGSASLKWEWREVEFRKEKFRVMAPYYECDETKTQFTTTESDNIWWMHLHNQYCHKYGIPYVDEILSFRERYGVSALKMSLILGFGENQWRKYEQGEIPSISNGRMIRSAMNPKVFLDYVESSRIILGDKDYSRIKARLDAIIDTLSESRIEQYETGRVFSCERSAANGFALISLPRLKNVLLYVLQECGETFCTKMNKLLFYLDFLSYRERGAAMTGLSYRAIDFGPVPERWDRIYCEFDEVSHEPRAVGNVEGNVLYSSVEADTDMFSESELCVLNAVCDKFKNASSRDLTKLSHEEDAWIAYHSSQCQIPFETAFALRNI